MASISIRRTYFLFYRKIMLASVIIMAGAEDYDPLRLATYPGYVDTEL